MLLGVAVGARVDDVVADVARLTDEAGESLGPAIEDTFADVARVVSSAVATWIAGADISTARQMGLTALRNLAELAAQRGASLNEITKRCLRWRDAFTAALTEEARKLDVSPDALDKALRMTRRSFDVTLVRLGEAYEAERQQAHEHIRRQRDELELQATRDVVTGLPNRSALHHLLDQALARAEKGSTDVAAVVLDLDHYRNVNHTLGSDAGDRLLRAVSARLSSFAPPPHIVGRLGGDEFAIVVEGETSAHRQALVDGLLKRLREGFVVHGPVGPPVTLTFGAGVALGDGVTASRLLLEAGLAMHVARQQGKRWRFFDPGMMDTASSRLALEVDVRTAVFEDQFAVAYQPIVDLRSASIVGVEALLRWRHPRRGNVTPDDFVPVLEQTELIDGVGGWVLREACRQAAAWHARGHWIRMAVNVSAHQLDDGLLLRQVEDALADSGLAPGALVVEITESTVVREAAAAMQTLNEVRALGVRVAIDDFGTGHSSLERLHEIPVDVLKIDRSFVHGMLTEPGANAIVRMVIQLSHELGIETVAEGIEQADQLALLRRYGCALGQGFLFSEPLAPELLADLT